jgi:hypothetical protein
VPDDQAAGKLRGPRFPAARRKYSILLCGDEATLRRYFKSFTGFETGFARRHYFPENDWLVFATAVTIEQGWLQHDAGLHCHVVYNTVHLLLDGYRGYWHDLPAWFESGLAQWYLRRLDPRWPNFDRAPELEPDMRNDPGWEPRVAGLVRNRACTPAARMLAWIDFADFKFHDYAVAWSRVDFLIQQGDPKFRTFVEGLKAPILDTDKKRVDYSFRVLTPAELLERQRKFLQAAYGWSIEQFDEEWQRYVLAHYPGAKDRVR